MNAWVLFAWLLFVWLLPLVGEMNQKAIEDMRAPLPKGQRRGVELFPIMPFFPLVFLGIAKLVDLAAAPWGTVIIASLHAILAVWAVIVIIRDEWILRKSGFYTHKPPDSTRDEPCE